MARWINLAGALAAGTVLGTMVLGGCGRQETPPAEDLTAVFAGDYTAKLAITMGGIEAAGDLTREGERTAVVITSPEHLEGLTFTVDGAGCGVSFKGLAVEEAEMPGGSLGRALDGALDALSLPEGLEPCTDEDGQSAVRGETENGSFLLSAGEGSACLRMPALDLTVQMDSLCSIQPSADSPEEDV